MIESIAIRNLAIVENLTCELGSGLNVFTGETGAGKSLVVDALGLLLGERARPDLIGVYGDRLQVEASFLVEEESRAWIDTIGFPEGVLFVAREFTLEGKNRARVNGRSVPLSLLREAVAHLVHLHGQQEHEVLLSPAYQLDVLDRFAGEWALSLRQEAEGLLGEAKSLVDQIQEIDVSQRERTRQSDLLRYEINEIEAARLQEREDVSLQQELAFLQAQARIRQELESLQVLLGGSSQSPGCLDPLERASRSLTDLRSRFTQLQPIQNRLESLVAELVDFTWDLRAFLGGMEIDNRRIEQVEERLDTIARLKRKYGSQLEEIGHYLQQARERQTLLESAEERRGQLEQLRLLTLGQLEEKLQELRRIRREAKSRLEAEIPEELRDLGIEHTEFVVQLEELPTEQLRNRGLDRLEFLFSANPGEKVKPLVRVASGGELSRLMLVIKAALARTDPAATLVFDELDAGISGRVGEQLAAKLKQVSRYHQVICITHLAQIAAAADVHIMVEKDTSGANSRVTERRVTGPERVREIGRMLGGSQLSQAVLAHAEELLGKRVPA